MRADHPSVYPYSAAEAKRRNELDSWRESFRMNVSCKEAIEDAVRSNFNGMHLNEHCVDDVIEQFGFKRTMWVLSNTIQQKDWDGRFSTLNKNWAKQVFIPYDERHNHQFVVESHPAVLDGFVDLYRKEYRALGLFGAEHCEPDSFSDLDYEGRVLVLSPDTLRESCWRQEDQLWLAHDGFGCTPHAIGRSVRCTCLGDGEETRWNRSEFIGVLKEEYLPDWAREKLEELQPKQDEELRLQL